MIVILGGGFGGLATARELRRLVDDEIVVVDKKDKFSVGMANLWLMNGERSKPIEKELNKIEEQEIRFLNEEIVNIDARNKIVKTVNRELHADYIVIALGAEMDLDAVEGFREGALNLYDSNDAMEIHNRLKRFEGRIILLVSSLPYKCPPAPYEAVLLLDSYFRKRGKRDAVEIMLYTPEPKPVQIAGDDISRVMKSMLDDHKIAYSANMQVRKIDAKSKKVLFDEWVDYDLLIGIPVHKAPKVLGELIDESGWISVDPKSLESKYEGVYAIGDATIVKIDGIAIPKAGTFAEREGVVVANNIASKINNNEQKEYDGYGYCYIDVGDGRAALVEGHFYEKPHRVELKEASEYYKKKMVEFEKERLDML